VDGDRLDRVLADGLTDLSRSRLKALIVGGHVAAEGETITDPSYRVKRGQAFVVDIPEAQPAVPQGEAIALDVVYEDDAIIVVDKPPGMVVHPAAGNPDGTLVNALLAHCGDSLSGIGGVKRPGIVHRLDKDTSGLIVAAKNDAAHAALAAQLADRSMSRIYHALVWGRPVPAHGTIDKPLGRDPRNRKRMAIRTRGGKPAVTHYRTLRHFGTDNAGISLVECRLDSGRTHQIRVHMASIGHPVIGDPVYSRARRGRAGGLPETLRVALDSFQRQALHAVELALVHPLSGKTLKFHVEYPNDIKHLVALLDAHERPQ
jgi:23S rRNA pseudouridine1911/1915/1917 synthase